jgi:hypothetical protein
VLRVLSLRQTHEVSRIAGYERRSVILRIDGNVVTILRILYGGRSLEDAENGEPGQGGRMLNNLVTRACLARSTDLA